MVQAAQAQRALAVLVEALQQQLPSRHPVLHLRPLPMAAAARQATHTRLNPLLHPSPFCSQLRTPMLLHTGTLLGCCRHDKSWRSAEFQETRAYKRLSLAEGES